MTRTAIVIGGGITGVACALNLVRDGWTVTLVDPRGSGDPGQTSFGNAGLLAYASIVPVQTPGLIWRAPRMLFDPREPLFLRWRYLPRLMPWLVPFLRNGSEARLARIVPAIQGLVHDSLDQHRALAAGTPAADLIAAQDYAFLFRDRAAFAASSFAFGLKAAHGLSWEERDAARLRADDPMLGPGIGFATVFPDHGWIADPGAYVAALAGAFQRLGGSVLRAEARAIQPEQGGVAVETGAGRIRAYRLVLAAGVWSRPLAERLGLNVPMETERGYHVTLANPSHRPPFPYMLDAAALVVTPMAPGLRFAGMVEFGGIDAPPSEAPTRLIRKAVAALYPTLTWEGETRWMGHRPTTVDSLPMVGAVPGAPNVLCAFGGQHLGLTMGAKLGRIIADLAGGRRANLDLEPYAPGRFGGGAFDHRSV